MPGKGAIIREPARRAKKHGPEIAHTAIDSSSASACRAAPVASGVNLPSSAHRRARHRGQLRCIRMPCGCRRLRRESARTALPASRPGLTRPVSEHSPSGASSARNQLDRPCAEFLSTRTRVNGFRDNYTAYIAGSGLRSEWTETPISSCRRNRTGSLRPPSAYP